MTPAHLAEMRAYLKDFRVTPTGEEYLKQADVINHLIPALVDSISDSELEELIGEFRSYLLYSIIAGPAITETEDKEEQEGVAPSITSATSQELD